MSPRSSSPTPNLHTPRTAPRFKGIVEGFSVRLDSDPPGLLEVPALKRPRVAIHAGPPVEMTCRRCGHEHHGVELYGDIDIIPAETPAAWELKGNDRALIMVFPLDLLARVAQECGLDPSRLELKNRFQMRDAQIEHLGWALKTEMEEGYPGGRLYLESLATALALNLVTRHSSLSPSSGTDRGSLSGGRLREALSFIEENLGQNISLEDVAGISDLSVSHFNLLFRRAVGEPVHRYVIRRRVERAQQLLREGRLSITQVALETGFAHQSHLARHTRRRLGLTPKQVRNGGS